MVDWFELNPDVRASFTRLMQSGDFYEAHEVMETEWIQNGRPRGSALQGLILLAVACEHQRRGNQKGATRVFTRANQFLSSQQEQDDFIRWCVDFTRSILAS